MGGSHNYNIVIKNGGIFWEKRGRFWEGCI